MAPLIMLILSVFARNSLCDDSGGNQWEQYVAASTNDLKRLFDIEKEFLSEVDRFVYESKGSPSQQVQKDVEAVTEAFTALNVSQWRQEDSLEYVSHPINAFHLIKRTSLLWPKILEEASDDLDDVTEDYLIKFPMIDDLEYGASVGLVNLEMYYGSNGNDFYSLVDGLVTDTQTGETYRSKHKLTIEDMIMISNAAQRVWHLEKYVEWREAAVQVAIKNQESDLTVKKLKKLVQEAQDLHDNVSVFIPKSIPIVLTLFACYRY